MNKKLLNIEDNKSLATFLINEFELQKKLCYSHNFHRWYIFDRNNSYWAQLSYNSMKNFILEKLKDKIPSDLYIQYEDPINTTKLVNLIKVLENELDGKKTGINIYDKSTYAWLSLEVYRERYKR